VLVCLERQRIARIERLETTLRHGEGVMRKVDALFLFVPLIEREVDDPAQRELLGINDAQISADLGAGFAGEFVELLRATSDEEHGIAVLETELGLEGRGALFADILGNRAGACAILEEYIRSEEHT